MCPLENRLKLKHSPKLKKGRKMRRKPVKKSVSKRIFKNTSAPHPKNQASSVRMRGGIRLAGN